jgi:predicted sulfurtransferase
MLEFAKKMSLGIETLESEILRKIIGIYSHSLLDDSHYKCCDFNTTSIGEMKKHINQTHILPLNYTGLNLDKLLEIKKKFEKNAVDFEQNGFLKKRNKNNRSDSVGNTCDCSDGRVLLFYNYLSVGKEKLAQEIFELCKTVNIRGKIRIAGEGYNITVGGTVEATAQFAEYFMNGLTPGLELLSKDERDKFFHLFFKPSKGCCHVFDELNVKIVQEICVFDDHFVSNPIKPHSQKVAENILSQKSNTILAHSDSNLEQAETLKTEIDHKIHSLSPPEFHAFLLKTQNDPNYLLLDVRNYYESKIGYFQNAILPPIRKFKNLPDYIRKHEKVFEKTNILTYCTGGIRCEKASRFIQKQTGSDIFVLEGGIHNYLDWISSTSLGAKDENRGGIVSLIAKDGNTQNLFKGNNYVFDARKQLKGSGLVAKCKNCDQLCGDYQKCSSSNCHLIVSCCEDCTDVVLFCCEDCRETGLLDDKSSKGFECYCERVRKSQGLHFIAE